MLEKGSACQLMIWEMLADLVAEIKIDGSHGDCNLYPEADVPRQDNDSDAVE